MPSQRAIFLLAGAALVAAATPVGAQVPDDVVLNIMRECAKIDDATARLACYDNNIRSAGGNPRSVPGQGPRPRGGGAPLAGAGAAGPEGFGAESVKGPERFQSYEESGRGPDQITTRVTAVRQSVPGVYLVTLEGGAQWQFSESVDNPYVPPRRGDKVEIKRAALGSFLMVINGQQGVRVRRIR